MAELGLVPNATLHLKLTGKQSPPTTLNLSTDMAQALKVITASGASGTSKLLGQSSSIGTGSGLGGLHSDFTSSAMGSSILSTAMSAGLDSTSLLTGINTSLGPGIGTGYLPTSVGLGSAMLGLGGMPPSVTQYYSGTGMSAAMAAAAANVKERPLGGVPLGGFTTQTIPGATVSSGFSSLASCSIGAFSTQPYSGHSTIAPHSSSPRPHYPSPSPSSVSMAGGGYFLGHSPRRTPSPALPVIPPNLHPALTSTLPNLFLPDDIRESSSDAS